LSEDVLQLAGRARSDGGRRRLRTFAPGGAEQRERSERAADEPASCDEGHGRGGYTGRPTSVMGAAISACGPADVALAPAIIIIGRTIDSRSGGSPLPSTCYIAHMASAQRVLYPDVEPYRTGRLQVGGAHELYFEESGNPNGK